jgi:hypothetical protein
MNYGGIWDLKKNINIEFNFKNNQIALKIENNVIQNLNEFIIEFKNNQFKFVGERIKKDRNGQLLDKFEKINLFNYFSDEFLVLEDLQSFCHNLNFALHNIYETSKFNAKKYIEERGFNYNDN